MAGSTFCRSVGQESRPQELETEQLGQLQLVHLGQWQILQLGRWQLLKLWQQHLVQVLQQLVELKRLLKVLQVSLVNY